MKNRTVFLGLLITLISLTACEKLLIEQNEENTPLNNFHHLWRELDEGYVYFNYKQVDWDSVKAVFEPKIHNGMNEDELFNTLADMLETLRDGHVSIRQSRFDSRTYDVAKGYAPNFNKEFIINNYLIPNDMDTTAYIRHCFFNGDIGYLYYSTFTNEITEEGMEEILSKYADTKGLIIDVRGNMGGDASNINRLMEHFVLRSETVGFTQEKTGTGRNELSDKRAIVVSPKGTIYSNPIFVLTNRNCFSACNAFAARMSLLPNVTILGDDTGGGAGLPVANQLWNGWFFTYSSTIGSLPNGKVIEDGITPDIIESTDESYEALGIDNIIEKAIIQLQ